MSNNNSNPPDTDDTPQFSYAEYTLDEMLQAYASIDKEAFPERAEILQKLIIQRQSVSENINSSGPKILESARVKFHGNGTEYFAIWIVNILLSILTLGIYSAWATVRTNRYFYSNTEIVGHRLSYLAEPIQILKGRIIAVLLLAAYLIASNFSPMAALVIIAIIMLMTPFIIVIGVRFRMRMMSYRNVRFNFKVRFGRACVVFLLFPILGVLSLYLAMPWVLKKIDEFLYENMEYGDKAFSTNLSAGDYYVAAVVSSFIAFVGFIIIGIGFGVTAAIAGSEGQSIGHFLMLVLGAIVYLLVIVATASYYQAYIRNHVYNNTKIDDIATLKSDVKIFDLMVLNAGNYLMLICSLGLAIPWVKVRTAKFLSNATSLSILEGIEQVVATSGSQDSAVADEVIGAFDIDISIG